MHFDFDRLFPLLDFELLELELSSDFELSSEFELSSDVESDVLLVLEDLELLPLLFDLVLPVVSGFGVGHGHTV